MGNGALVKIGNLISSLSQMSIEALFCDVELAIWEPPMEVKIVHAESGLGEGVPFDVPCLILPIGHWIID